MAAFRVEVFGSDSFGDETSSEEEQPVAEEGAIPLGVGDADRGGDEFVLDVEQAQEWTCVEVELFSSRTICCSDYSSDRRSSGLVVD